MRRYKQKDRVCVSVLRVLVPRNLNWEDIQLMIELTLQKAEAQSRSDSLFARNKPKGCLNGRLTNTSMALFQR
jgi:hypothetical protein